MNCTRIRDQLTRDGADDPSRDVRQHLADCPGCARYAESLVAARQLLSERRSDFEPDPAFAARVSAALPASPNPLGWAAIRLLPVTLALALVLGGWTLMTSPSPSALLETGLVDTTLLETDTDDDLLAWVLEIEEGTP